MNPSTSPRSKYTPTPDPSLSHCSSAQGPKHKTPHSRKGTAMHHHELLHTPQPRQARWRRSQEQGNPPGQNRPASSLGLGVSMSAGRAETQVSQEAHTSLHPGAQPAPEASTRTRTCAPSTHTPHAVTRPCPLLEPLPPDPQGSSRGQRRRRRGCLSRRRRRRAAPRVGRGGARPWAGGARGSHRTGTGG